MEYRKVQKLGQNSYAISLPKKWIAKNGLAAGDSLLIRESNLDLIVSNPRLIEESPEPVITFPFDSNIRRNIILAYLVGAQRIIVKKDAASDSFSTDEREEIKNGLQSLVGTQIVAEDEASITIDFLASIDQEDIVQRVRQMYSLVMSMLETLGIVFQGVHPKVDVLKNIIARDVDVNRLYFSIVRQIRGMAKQSPLLGKLKTPFYKVVDYRVIAHILENSGDCCVVIAKELLRVNQTGALPLIPQPLANTFQAYSARAVQTHQQTQNAFIQSNSALIQEIIHRSTEEISLRVDVEQALHTLIGRPEIASFFTIFSNLQQIQEYAIDLCDLIE